MPDRGGRAAGGAARLVAGGAAAGAAPVWRRATRARAPPVAVLLVDVAPVRLARHKLDRQGPCISCTGTMTLLPAFFPSFWALCLLYRQHKLSTCLLPTTKKQKKQKQRQSLRAG